MKILLASAFVLISVSAAQANTIIYTCAPHHDDGDAYGETLVVGVPQAKPGSTERKVNLISDYFGSVSGAAVLGDANAASVVFSGFDTTEYDPRGFFIKNLKVLVPAAMLKAWPSKSLIKLSDDEREGVDYSCTRISE